MRGQGRAPKVRKATQYQNPQEKEEIREYLQRLRQIVPGCPKDGKLSRLELIQHVIDYIVQLQDTLLRHPINRLLGAEEDLMSPPPPLPATPPVSPVPQAMPAAQHYVTGTNTQSQPGGGFIVSSRSNTKRQGANSSSCRRPLGVLSSLNQHRSV